MTITDLRKTPFPYYGGKADAAPAVWAALGDVAHYVEPFAGSLAVLLRRPHQANRTYYSETVNDADGLLCNAWRAMQHDPDATAEAASWPVCEADVMARQLACLKWAADGNLERLMADPDYYDARIAGWWLYGICCWIGSGWCSGVGPWVVGADGRITKQTKSDGANRKLPHLTSNGQGVEHAGTREAGVARQLPHLGDDGRGVNRPQAREAGVATGAGVVDDADGCGLIIPDDLVFHPVVMPELRRWFQFLSARLRHVRIVNGDWTRVCTGGAMFTLPVRQGDGICGVFLDPPYAGATGRQMGLYTQDSHTIANEVRDWCIKWGGDKRLRIVLAGFDTEHAELERHGWRVVEWFTDGWLKGGMANQNDNGHQQHRERLWLSPHCLQSSMADLPMFAFQEDDDG